MDRMEVIAEFETNIEEFKKKEYKFAETKEIKEQILRQAEELAEKLKASSYFNYEISSAIDTFADVHQSRMDSLLHEVGQNEEDRLYELQKMRNSIFHIARLKNYTNEVASRVMEFFDKNPDIRNTKIKTEDEMTKEEIDEMKERKITGKKEKAELLERLMGTYPEFDELFGRKN